MKIQHQNKKKNSQSPKRDKNDKSITKKSEMSRQLKQIMRQFRTLKVKLKENQQWSNRQCSRYKQERLNITREKQDFIKKIRQLERKNLKQFEKKQKIMEKKQQQVQIRRRRINQEISLKKKQLQMKIRKIYSQGKLMCQSIKKQKKSQQRKTCQPSKESFPAKRNSFHPRKSVDLRNKNENRQEGEHKMIYSCKQPKRIQKNLEYYSQQTYA